MIHGFTYFSVEDHPLKERIGNAKRWLFTVNQGEVEPHTPWISLVWLGYRTLDGKFPFEEFVELEKRAELPQLETGEKARWECSLNTVFEYLRVLRGLEYTASREHFRWVRLWPSTIINILRVRALWACERYTKAQIQASDLSDATLLWNDASSRMIPAISEWPYNILEHHRAVEALQVIGQACWKAGVIKMRTHPDLLKRWDACWANEWHHKACRKALEPSNWHP